MHYNNLSVADESTVTASRSKTDADKFFKVHVHITNSGSLTTLNFSDEKAREIINVLSKVLES